QPAGRDGPRGRAPLPDRVPPGRVRRGTGLLLAAVLAAAPAAADESDFTLASIGIKGQAVFKNYTHFETTPNDDHLVIDEGILQVEWARRLGHRPGGRRVPRRRLRLRARAELPDPRHGPAAQLPRPEGSHDLGPRGAAGDHP